MRDGRGLLEYTKPQFKFSNRVKEKPLTSLRDPVLTGDNRADKNGDAGDSKIDTGLWAPGYKKGRPMLPNSSGWFSIPQTSLPHNFSVDR